MSGLMVRMNAWGALMRTAAMRGLIAKTGEYRKAKSAVSHAHAFPVWRRAAGGGGSAVVHG